MTLPELQARLQTVRNQYHVSPWIQPREDEAPLLRSWQRCLGAGMREHECVNFELVSRAWLAEIEDTHGELVRRSRTETERLAQSLRGTGATVLLFNTRGVVIDRLCHEASTPSTLLTATRVGVNAAERCVGTTAPSIALADGVPYLVGRDAHFFQNTRPFFCVAAPIDDPRGERVAALDITTYDSVPGFDVMSLVVDAAAAIENSLFRAGPDRLLVRFHPRAELVATALCGLLEVDDGGNVTGANRMAERLLSLPREVGTHPESGKVIMAGLGRYGPYLLHDGKYAKLTGTAEIFDIGMNAAVARIADAANGGGRGARGKAEPLKTFGPHPTSGGEMKLMAGRFGPYVTDGTTNATLPKTVEADALTEEEAIALIDARAAKGPAKGKKKAPAKKAAAKKTPAKKAPAKKKAAEE